MRASISFSLVAACTLGLVLTSHSPIDAADPAVRCESGKLIHSGVYGLCRLKAEAKAVKRGVAVDYSKCEAKFSSKFDAVEAAAGVGVCPSESDEASIDTRITTDTAEIATLLAGGTVTECGNSVVEVGEDCDFGDLAGESCATQGMFGEGLACTPGTCVFDTSGCMARWVDNGNGTVTDNETGLMWEKKVSGSGCDHCAGDFYRWSVSGSAPDGEVFTVFLDTLNGGGTGVGNCVSADGITQGGGFAGHCDWRLPTIAELQAIMLKPYPCDMVPCFDTTLGATLMGVGYWSATTETGEPLKAWAMDMTDARVFSASKVPGFSYPARAVRGGL